MSKINKNIVIFLGVVGFTCFFVAPVLADELGLEATRKAAELGTGSIPTIIGGLIGAALSFVGVLFFALMLYGGILWMLARGNQETEKKALNTIIGAIIGLIIVISSYAITNFVFLAIEGKTTTSTSGTSSTKQCLPGQATYADICQNICTSSGNNCVFTDDADINTICKDRCSVVVGACVAKTEYNMENECKKITSETACKKMKEFSLCEWK